MLSALTVHFRDIRDLLSNLLTFWFFTTPIIYYYKMPSVQRFLWLFKLNPFYHLVVSYQELLFFPGAFGHLAFAPVPRRRINRALPGRLLGLRSPAGFFCGGRVSDRHRTDEVTKIYRRYGGQQFATLKSALLQRSILRDLKPSGDVPGASRMCRSVCAKGSTFGVSAVMDRARARH